MALPRADGSALPPAIALAASLLLTGCAAATTSSVPASGPSARRTTTAPSSNTPRRSAPIRTTATRGSRSIARGIRASQEHYFRGRRLAAVGTPRGRPGRVPARVRAEPGVRRRRRGAARHAPEAPHQARGVARRQDGAAGAHRALARPRAAGSGPARPASSCPTRWCSATRAAGWCSWRSAGSRASTSSSIRRFRDAPISIDLRNASLEDALTSVTASTHTFYRVTAPEHHHDRPRHPCEAPRIRGVGRPDVLPEQRRHQGSDRPAAHRRRRAPDLADHGDQRDLAQGHAGADRRGGPDHRRDRQGAPGSRDRRRAARGRSLPAARVRPRACELRRSPGIAGSVDDQSRRPDAADP